MQNSMTGIIYDYYTSRIQFGYYREGDRLPSVSYICRQFQVSPLTVRSTLSRMREAGYIETIERKFARVIYRPDDEARQQYMHYFLTRRDGMDDLYRFSGIIFEPVALFYFQLQNDASIKKIHSQIKKAKGHPAKQVIAFYVEAMSPSNNPLVLNLYWEVARYLRIPYLTLPTDFSHMDSPAKKHIALMLSMVEAGNAQKAVDEMRSFHRHVTYPFFQQMDAASESPQTTGQVPFQWQIYREHPQLCYTLATKIMDRIDRRIYRQHEFLPSCRELAREFQVSHITMRRTLELLSDMRVTETLNGIGTRVAPGEKAGLPDFSHIQIRKSLILFLQAMQISFLTCKNVAINTLSDPDHGKAGLLSGQIQRIIHEQTAFLLGETCLQFIGSHSPSAFIREVYGQLYHLLLWGHALHVFFQKPERAHYYEACAMDLQKCLSAHDVQGFAIQLEKLMDEGVTIARSILLQVGFREEELIRLRHFPCAGGKASLPCPTGEPGKDRRIKPAP